MAHLSASKPRQGFADTINRAAYEKERVVVRRRGKDIAAVVPIDDLWLLGELEDQIDLADARAALTETKKKVAKSLDVILKDLGPVVPPGGLPNPPRPAGKTWHASRLRDLYGWC